MNILGAGFGGPTVTLDSGTHTINSLFIDRSTLTIAGGALNIVAPSSVVGSALATFTGINLNGGSLSIGSELLLGTRVTFGWTAGTLGGAGPLRMPNVGGPSLQISGSITKTLATTIVNSALINWTSGSLNFESGVIINNGTFRAAPSTITQTGSDSRIENAGVFRHNTPGQLTLFGVTFLNSGTIESSADIRTSGLFELNAGTLQGNLTIGTGGVGSSGTLKWTGGAMEGPGITSIAGGPLPLTSLRIEGPGTKQLRRLLIHDGLTALWSGGDIEFNNGTLEIRRRFNINTTASLIDGGGTNLVLNTAGLGVLADQTVTCYVPFESSSEIRLIGKLILLGGGTSAAPTPGTVVIDPTGELRVGGLGFVFAGDITGQLGNRGGALVIDSLAVTGSAIINAAVNLDSILLIGSGTQLTLNGPASVTNITVNPGAAAIIGNDLDVTGNLAGPSGNTGGDVIIHGGSGVVAGLVHVSQLSVSGQSTVLTMQGLSPHVSTINLSQGGTVNFTAGGSGVLRAGALVIEGGPAAPNARLNLADNAMVVAETPGHAITEAAIQSYINRGYAGGSWGGRGITSTVANFMSGQFALGYAQAGALGISNFLGFPVFASDTLIRYTRYGDADLDGSVNLGDFNRLASNFGASGRFWRQGDFNYDAQVNLVDFNHLASNFGQSLSARTLEGWDMRERNESHIGEFQT